MILHRAVITKDDDSHLLKEVAYWNKMDDYEQVDVLRVYTPTFNGDTEQKTFLEQTLWLAKHRYI